MSLRPWLIGILAFTVVSFAPASKAMPVGTAELEEDAGSSDSSVRRPALKRLAASGKEGKVVIARALARARDDTGKSVAEYVKKKRRQLARVVSKELAERRGDVLSVGRKGGKPEEFETALKKAGALAKNPYPFLRREVKPLAKRHRPLADVYADAKKYLGKKGSLPKDFETEKQKLLEWTRKLMFPPPSEQAKAIKAANKEAAEDLTAGEREMIELVNDYRAVLGYAPLKIDPRLVRACRQHSKVMKSKGFVGHDSPVPGHTTPDARCKQVGIRDCVGENVARAGKAKDVMILWRGSPPHHKNFVRSEAANIGVGVAADCWTLLVSGGG